MPLTAMQLFAQFNVPYASTAPWGSRFAEPRQGIYIVSTSYDLALNSAVLPNKGGQWIKALAIWPKLYIHYGVCTNPGNIEFQMLKFFTEHTSGLPFHFIAQPGNHIPFANREIKYDGYCCRKIHRFKKANSA